MTIATVMLLSKIKMPLVRFFPLVDHSIKTLARHREKPTRYTVAEAIDALETFAKLNCDLRGYAEFEDKYERFKNNFLAYKIMG